MESLKVLSMASAAARHGAARHSTIAENVANADTPGYVAKDLAPFSSVAEDFGGNSFAPRATRAGHVFASRDETIAQTAFEVMTKESVSPNGNGVSLEEEMVKSAEAQGQHDLAVTIYRKSLDILRASMGRIR